MYGHTTDNSKNTLRTEGDGTKRNGLHTFLNRRLLSALGPDQKLQRDQGESLTGRCSGSLIRIRIEEDWKDLNLSGEMVGAGKRESKGCKGRQRMGNEAR